MWPHLAVPPWYGEVQGLDSNFWQICTHSLRVVRLRGACRARVAHAKGEQATLELWIQIFGKFESRHCPPDVRAQASAKIIGRPEENLQKFESRALNRALPPWYGRIQISGFKFFQI